MILARGKRLSAALLHGALVIRLTCDPRTLCLEGKCRFFLSSLEISSTGRLIWVRKRPGYRPN